MTYKELVDIITAQPPEEQGKTVNIDIGSISKIMIGIQELKEVKVSTENGLYLSINE